MFRRGIKIFAALLLVVLHGLLLWLSLPRTHRFPHRFPSSSTLCLGAAAIAVVAHLPLHAQGPALHHLRADLPLLSLEGTERRESCVSPSLSLFAPKPITLNQPLRIPDRLLSLPPILPLRHHSLLLPHRQHQVYPRPRSSTTCSESKPYVNATGSCRLRKPPYLSTCAKSPTMPSAISQHLAVFSSPTHVLLASRFSNGFVGLSTAWRSFLQLLSFVALPLALCCWWCLRPCSVTQDSLVSFSRLLTRLLSATGRWHWPLACESAALASASTSPSAIIGLGELLTSGTFSVFFRLTNTLIYISQWIYIWFLGICVRVVVFVIESTQSGFSSRRCIITPVSIFSSLFVILTYATLIIPVSLCFATVTFALCIAQHSVRVIQMCLYSKSLLVFPRSYPRSNLKHLNFIRAQVNNAKFMETVRLGTRPLRHNRYRRLVLLRTGKMPQGHQENLEQFPRMRAKIELESDDAYCFLAEPDYANRKLSNFKA